MIKIKYITNVRLPTPRALGYAIMKMCEEFASQGAGVDLVIPRRQHNEDTLDPFVYYGIKKNFNLVKISSTDFLGRTLKFGRMFYWADSLTFLCNLFLNIKINKDEVVYTRDFLVALIFPKKYFICLEIHDIPKSSFLFSYIISKPKLFFVLNVYIKEALMELGVAESKIHVTPSGVDLEFFKSSCGKSEARSSLNLPQDKKIVLYTGHFYAWKGVDTLALSAKLLPDILFIFIGGVDPELTEFKKKYKDIANISILSFQERGILPLYLKASDVLVVPNSKHLKISSEYTSPLKLFEYMASERPIVASDLPSIRQILNENNCTFATPDKPVSFAQAIKNIIENEANSQKLTKNALVDVGQYSWTLRAEKILALISKNEI